MVLQGKISTLFYGITYSIEYVLGLPDPWIPMLVQKSRLAHILNGGRQWKNDKPEQPQEEKRHKQGRTVLFFHATALLLS